MNPFQQSIIDAYAGIDDYTRQKGDVILGSGLMSDLQQSDRQISATVLGSSPYRVHLKYKYQLVFTCECPQSKKYETGYCKHISALMHHALDRLVFDTQSPAGTKVGPSSESLSPPLSAQILNNQHFLRHLCSSLEDPSHSEQLFQFLNIPFLLSTDAAPSASLRTRHDFSQEEGSAGFQKNFRFAIQPSLYVLMDEFPRLTPQAKDAFAAVSFRLLKSMECYASNDPPKDPYNKLNQVFQSYLELLAQSIQETRQLDPSPWIIEGLSFKKYYTSFLVATSPLMNEAVEVQLIPALKSHCAAQSAPSALLFDQLYTLLIKHQHAEELFRYAHNEWRPSVQTDLTIQALKIQQRPDDLLAYLKEEALLDNPGVFDELILWARRNNDLEQARTYACKAFQLKPSVSTFQGLSSAWEDAGHPLSKCQEFVDHYCASEAFSQVVKDPFNRFVLTGCAEILSV